MNIIKHLKEDKIELNGIVYKPYKICNLPPSFGMVEEFEDENGKIYTRKLKHKKNEEGK